MSKVTDLYGSMVFNEHVMRERLPKATYKQLMKTIKEGAPLDEDVANVVAHAMKEWAIEKGATHYTHWFQPLTGITSEKHDLPLRRPARHLRGPRLHRLGSHLLRLH